MRPKGFTSLLKGSAVAAFLAVTAPSEAPAQSFDMMSPNNMMNPAHPFNPLTDPFGVWGTHDGAKPASGAAEEKAQSTAPESKKEQQNNAALILISLLGAFTVAGAVAMATKQERKPPPPLKRSPYSTRGSGDF